MFEMQHYCSRTTNFDNSYFYVNTRICFAFCGNYFEAIQCHLFITIAFYLKYECICSDDNLSAIFVQRVPTYHIL
jgi:hypothetical protein